MKFIKVEDDSKVNLSKFSELRGENIVLSKFSGIPSAKRAKLSRKSRNADARRVKCLSWSFSLVNRNDKMQGRKRGPKYKAMSKIILDFIQEAVFRQTSYQTWLLSNGAGVMYCRWCFLQAISGSTESQCSYATQPLVDKIIEKYWFLLSERDSKPEGNWRLAGEKQNVLRGNSKVI